MTDERALTRVLRQFARTMAGSYDITRALYDLSDSVVEVLGATAAGVALLDGDELRFVTATSPQGAEAERAQERFQSGPCVDSIRQDQPVPVTDIADRTETWPDYAPAAEAIGFRGILGLPLVLDERRVGSLDIYQAEPREWTDDAIGAAQALADIGAAYILNATELDERQRTAEQLQTALDSRILIEQAKGVLAERHGEPMVDAFERLRRHARSNNRSVRDVAADVLAGDLKI